MLPSTYPLYNHPILVRRPESCLAHQASFNHHPSVLNFPHNAIHCLPSFSILHPKNAKMSHLWNPLATPQQLESSSTTINGPLPPELQDSIRFSTARLTQAAGILLRLPQDIAAQAVVVLMRFWVTERLMEWEFSVR